VGRISFSGNEKEPDLTCVWPPGRVDEAAGGRGNGVEPNVPVAANPNKLAAVARFWNILTDTELIRSSQVVI
jgi:hypothetical protein